MRRVRISADAFQSGGLYQVWVVSGSTPIPARGPSHLSVRLEFKGSRVQEFKQKNVHLYLLNP